MSPQALATEALRLDFAPDLLAIQESPPARLPRAVGLSIVGASALLLVWAAFAKLDVVAVAEGRLVPSSFVKVVQAADAGVVGELLVADGDSVSEGQLLIRLDRRASGADRDAAEREVWLARLSLQRAQAELEGRADLQLQVPPAAPSWLPGLAAQVRAQFAARRSAQADALAQERENLNRARADLGAARQILDKLSATLPAFQQSAKAFESLAKDGFVGELAAGERAREALEREQDLKAQAATVESLQAAVAQSQKRLAALESQYRAELEGERVELQSRLGRGEAEWEKSRVHHDLQEVRAPQAGVIKDLAIAARGAVVQAGNPLLTIVPRGDAMQAEVQLKNEDAGFVGQGQPARIKIASYPFQKFGLLDGHVTLVGADALDPRQAAAAAAQPPAGSPWTYRAWIALDSSLPAGASAPLKLQPGMAVTAEISQGQRTVLEYLLSPVRKMTQEAARER